MKHLYILSSFVRRMSYLVKGTKKYFQSGQRGTSSGFYARFSVVKSASQAKEGTGWQKSSWPNQIVAFTALILFFSCQNFEIDHPDYDHTAAYFPYQFPVRTIILGDYIYDNSNDNDHKFLISVAMGGVYENKEDREFTFRIDESLCDDVLFDQNGDTIRMLPREYFNLSSDNTIVIPRDKFYGSVEVQLTEPFFQDPNSINLQYVVPLRLESSNDVDSILNGSTSNPDADPRMAGDWIVAPKNFTMFAVKYINEYDGNYFHYGSNSISDESGNVIEENAYSEEFVVNNSVSRLVTTGRNSVKFSTNMRSDTLSGTIDMILTFEGEQGIVQQAEGSPYTITGTVEYKNGAFEWGNKPRNGIVMNYTVSDGNFTYEATETLVSRDRAVVLETYNPVKMEP